MELTKRDRKTIARLNEEAAMRKAFPNGTHMLAPGENAPRPILETARTCTCGRMISANKQHCLKCSETLQLLKVSFEAEKLNEKPGVDDRAEWLQRVDAWSKEHQAELDSVYGTAFAAGEHDITPHVSEEAA